MTEATIFMAALEKPTEAERAAFLAEACAGDERLRRRVEALLRAHDEPDDILDPTIDQRLDAIAAFEKSETEVLGVFTAAAGFLLAMAYWRLGEKEKAREWYAKALQSVETASQPAGRELSLFRSEAGRLLGISDPASPSKGGD
jgi:tetratricopeptide (TPR) repeat protein